MIFSFCSGPAGHPGVKSTYQRAKQSLRTHRLAAHLQTSYRAKGLVIEPNTMDGLAPPQGSASLMLRAHAAHARTRSHERGLLCLANGFPAHAVCRPLRQQRQQTLAPGRPPPVKIISASSVASPRFPGGPSLEPPGGITQPSCPVGHCADRSSSSLENSASTCILTMQHLNFVVVCFMGLQHSSQPNLNSTNHPLDASKPHYTTSAPGCSTSHVAHPARGRMLAPGPFRMNIAIGVGQVGCPWA